MAYGLQSPPGSALLSSLKPGRAGDRWRHGRGPSGTRRHGNSRGAKWKPQLHPAEADCWLAHHPGHMELAGSWRSFWDDFAQTVRRALQVTATAVEGIRAERALRVEGDGAGMSAGWKLKLGRPRHWSSHPSPPTHWATRGDKTPPQVLGQLFGPRESSHLFLDTTYFLSARYPRAPVGSRCH